MIRDKERRGWSEPLNTSFFIQMHLDLAIQLTKLVIRLVEWAKWNELDRIRREIRRVLLVMGFGGAMLNLVEFTMKFSHDPPRTCEGVRELVDLPAHCIGTNSLTCVDNIAYCQRPW